MWETPEDALLDVSPGLLSRRVSLRIRTASLGPVAWQASRNPRRTLSLPPVQIPCLVRRVPSHTEISRRIRHLRMESMKKGAALSPASPVLTHQGGAGPRFDAPIVRMSNVSISKAPGGGVERT